MFTWETSVAHFWLGSGCLKVPVENVWSRLAHFSLIGLVLYNTLTGVQMHLLHQTLYKFVVHMDVVVVKIACDALVSISALVVLEYLGYGYTKLLVLVTLLKPFHMIVESRPCHAMDLEQQLKTMFPP